MRSLGRICFCDTIFCFQSATQTVSCRRLVIHNQYRLHGNLPCFFTLLLPYFFASSIGSVTLNLVPCPSFTGLSQSTLPPNSTTRRATIAKPKPVPCDFVVKKGCRIFSRSAAGIPGPSSSTCRQQSPFSNAALTLTCPPRGVASNAFTTRFDTMSFSASALIATLAFTPEVFVCNCSPRRSASCESTPTTSSTTTAASQLPVPFPPRTAGRLNCSN